MALQTLRVRGDLTIDQLAAAMGVEASVVERIERFGFQATCKDCKSKTELFVSYVRHTGREPGEILDFLVQFYGRERDTTSEIAQLEHVKGRVTSPEPSDLDV